MLEDHLLKKVLPYPHSPCNLLLHCHSYHGLSWKAQTWEHKSKLQWRQEAWRVSVHTYISSSTFDDCAYLDPSDLINVTHQFGKLGVSVKALYAHLRSVCNWATILNTKVTFPNTRRKFCFCGCWSVEWNQFRQVGSLWWSWLTAEVVRVLRAPWPAPTSGLVQAVGTWGLTGKCDAWKPHSLRIQPQLPGGPARLQRNDIDSGVDFTRLLSSSSPRWWQVMTHSTQDSNLGFIKFLNRTHIHMHTQRRRFCLWQTSSWITLHWRELITTHYLYGTDWTEQSERLQNKGNCFYSDKQS